jgi:signal transduction histidine kinase
VTGPAEVAAPIPSEAEVARPRRLPRWATSLTAKYALVFALLAAVPTLAVSAYLLDSSYNRTRQHLIELQQEKAKSLAVTVQQTLRDQVSRLTALNVYDKSNAERELLLRSVLLDTSVLATGYVNARGREVARLRRRGGVDLSPQSMSHQRFFEQALKHGAYFSPVTYISPLAGPQMGDLELSLEIDVADNAGGVVREVLLPRPELSEVIVATHLGRAGYAYIVDSRGAPVAHPNFVVRNDYAGGRLKSLAVLPQVAEALESSVPTGSASGRNFRHVRVLSAWATVPSTGWKVFFEQPESEVFAPLSGTVWRTVLLLLAFVAGAVALAVLLAGRLVRPIKRMQVAAAAIGGGAYQERIELDRRDELGDLAQTFNRMAVSLQELITGLEWKVAERTQELEVASKHKSDFLANMSHELRTPLNAIVGFSQVLQEELYGELNEKQKEHLGHILSSANHQLSLINDILDISKVEAGHVELEVAPFSLREALERGVLMVKERAVKDGVAIDLDLDPAADSIEGDERRVRQVVFNLLSNAVKFTPDGGRVEIRTVRDDGEVTVSVADTGPGIAREDQELIFEEFQQARVVEGERPQGTGLGLALSRTLVELHGGRIWVESSPGRGSVFSFTLPVGSR